jgi:hypothetical protein
MTNGVSKNYGLPQLTEAQLVEFMREHVDHGVVFVKYHAGTATVLRHEEVSSPSNYSACDEHETTFPKGGQCPKCVEKRP